MVKKFLMWLLLVLTINHPGRSQSIAYAAGLVAVDLEILKFMKKWELHAGSIALVKDGKLAYVRAFGKADSDLPAQPDQLYRIASLSKPITAMGILSLVQEKKLSLDDHVFGADGLLNDPQYLNIKDARVRDITVRHLLHHTAGWDRNAGPVHNPMFKPIEIARHMKVSAPATSETIIQYLLSKELDFTPGSKFCYSNVGYSILGRVIEKVTGMAYEAYIQQTLLDPLQISTMSLGFNVKRHPGEVRYYDIYHRQAKSVNGLGVIKPIAYGGFNLEAMDAHGGWIASASDLAKLLVASHGYGTDRDLLTPALLDTMMTPSPVYGGYGMGWFINKKGNRWHTGSLPGCSAIMADLPNGIGWVMLFNGNPQTSEYFSSLDTVMWNALKNINNWPDHDLFLPPAEDSVTPPDPIHLDQTLTP